MRKTGEWAGFMAVVAVAFWFLGPAALGGPASYVIVDGTSMDPTYANGDLVIARVQDAYAIGDVITYDAPVDVDFPVIHRIIEVTDNGFITQGDNRDEPDGWVVAPDSIHGASWLHIPRGGAIVAFLRQPAAIISLVSAWLVFAWLSRRERRDDDSDEPDDTPLSRTERRKQQKEKRIAASLLSAAVLLGGASGLYVAHAATLHVDGGVLQAFFLGASDLPERPPVQDEDVEGSLIEQQTTRDVDELAEADGSEPARDADRTGGEVSDPGTDGPDIAEDLDASSDDDEPGEDESDAEAPTSDASDAPDDEPDVDTSSEGTSSS
jgi:signal peptidase I